MKLKRLTIAIKSILFGFFDIIPNASTPEIIGLFGIIWFLLIFGWIAIRPMFFLDLEPFIWDYIIISVSFFVGGIGGVIMIIRRDFPSFSRLAAILLGAFFLLSGWGIAAYSLWLAMVF
ncbi:MAG: hypothetical protein GY796_36195 [Chloroflexi bacterium]|nr:hypothetical protein [Chloroflexota bacterium]